MKAPSSLLTISIALFGLFVFGGPVAAAPAPRPHIVFLLADDLGWKDVGYHGGNIKTPNLDKLATSGVRLEQFYVLPVCSPTRATLMTGRYPMRYGLQVGVVRPWARYGLPLSERTLADALGKAGYRTAIVGKWHLGHFEPAYLPTKRGFTHQYGHYNGAIDYYTHRREGGLDWHRNDKALREEGYSTQLLTREAVRLIGGHDVSRPLFLYVPFDAPHGPLQAPTEYLDRYRHIAQKNRRTYAAMVSCLDDGVGAIVAALEKRGMRKDTLIVFSSDNGGPLRLGADNGPLRAGKGTLYEGGTRVAAFANWPGRLKAGVVKAPLHMVDWYPTLLKLAGATLAQKLPLDGRDIWPTIAEGKPSPRDEMLYNVEPRRGALRKSDWKLVVFGKLPSADVKGLEVESLNLADDPNEKTNLAGKQPAKVRELLARLNAYAKAAVPPRGQGGGMMPKKFKAPAVWGEGGKPMTDVIYSVATSLDGFIAPPDGSSDWLSSFMQSGEDYGMGTFMASVGAVLMGSRTYEKALGYMGKGPSPTPCYVFSSRQLPVAGPNVTITTASPQEVVAELDERGITRTWLMGGARLLSSFRAAGVVTEYALAVMPVVLGGGTPLFESPGPTASLRLVEHKVHPSGVVQLRYRVVRG